MTVFSREEVNKRHQRFRSCLGDCSAGVVFSFTNSYYLSGVPIIAWGRPTIVVVPKNGEPLLILAIGEKERAIAHSPISVIYTYTDDDGPSAQTAVRILGEILKSKKYSRIAYDAAMAPAGMLDSLRSLIPDLHLKDLSQELDELRLVNSEEELAHLRAATAIADLGVETFLSEARIGAREVALAGRTMMAMTEYAADRYPNAEVRVNCYSQQGARSLQPHTAANGDPLTPGQLMCLVVEAHVWSYQAAVERVIAVGDLNPEQALLRDTIVEAQKRAIAAVAPGVACSTIDEVARESFRAAGYTNLLCGAGLSRGVLSEWEGRIERGNLRSYNHSPLLPGMVITVEPFTAVPGVGAPRHCDMVGVTSDGHEVMSKARSGIIRIG